MHYVYIIKSLKDGKYYIGSTENIKERLERHNQGRVVSTKHRRPFKLIYKESCRSVIESLQREKQLKRYKGGEAFKFLIS